MLSSLAEETKDTENLPKAIFLTALLQVLFLLSAPTLCNLFPK
jgi:hypothetical protein